MALHGYPIAPDFDQSNRQRLNWIRANFDQIHEKMSKEEVQAILGSPSSTSTEDKLIYKRTTWRYVEGDKYINITFKNDEMDSKDTNLGTQ
jgi:outer membrane protein assembly factor BamE (lipoprotein component of BamABCDE complex)